MSQNLDPFTLQNASSNMYPNPFFDYLSRIMPRNIKDMFQWLEYLYANSGQVMPVIKKFSEYAITEIVYNSSSPKVKENAKKIFNEKLNLKDTIINISNDFHLYGNSFTSLYRPFIRSLECRQCGHKHNVEKTEYSWEPKSFSYLLCCIKCKHHGKAKVVNIKLRDITRLKIIRWDPKHMEIEYNPVTGESQYYYNFPEYLKKELKKKNPSPFILDRMPWEYIQAMKSKKLFKFKSDKIFHLKNPSPAGVSQEWGFPGLLTALKPYFYTAVLKKANEATAFERLNPWRVMYPQAASSTSDPAMYMNLNKWRTELQSAIRNWKRDPNSIKLSPIPVGVQQIGGDGRALLLHQEIKMEEENIITSMGVPVEFIRGGLTHTGGSVTLRMIENILFTFTSQLERMMQWMTDEVNNYMNYEKVKVHLVPFKLVDDVQQKQLVLQLWEAGKVSDTTASEFFDIDFGEERKKLLSDSEQNAKTENLMSRMITQMQNNVAEQVRQQENGDPLNYDPAAVYAIAEEQAMQLTQIPAEERKQALKEMEMADPVLHAVVTKIIRSIFSSQQAQGVGSAMGGQHGGGGGFSHGQNLNGTPAGGSATGSGPAVGM